MRRAPSRRTGLRCCSLRLLRELMLCVVLPSIALVSVRVVAQKSQKASLPASQESDNRIADAINAQLMASNTLRPLDLGVWVHDGVATLSGTVPTQALKQQADRLVQSVAGVKSVDDQMTIGALPTVAPGFPPAGQSQATAGNDITVGPAPSTPSSQSGQAAAPYANAAPMRGQQSGGANSPPARVYSTRPSQPLLTVPRNTPLYVMMLRTVDSHHTQPGTPFRGLLVRDVALRNGVIAVPRGAYVEGTVIDARPPGHLKGSPELALQLSNVIVGRTSYVLTTDTWAHKGPGKGGETAGAVGGGAAFGAIAGAMAGGGPIALLGAAIGGLGGAGLSALSSGPHLVVPAESVVTFRLNAPLTVREPTPDEVAMLANHLPGYRGRYYRRPPPYPYARPYPPSYPPPIPGAPPGGYPY